MKEGVDLYFEIDQYLKGELDGEALKDFESELDKNPALKEELLNQKALNEIVIGAQLDLLRDKMTRDIENLDQNLNNRKKWWISGFILITCLSVVTLVISSKKEEKTQNVVLNEKVSENFSQNKEEINTSAPKVNIGKSDKVLTFTAKTTEKDALSEAPVKNYASNNSENKSSEVEPKNIAAADTVRSNEVAPLNLKNKCAGIYINFDITTSPACTSKNDGEIRCLENTIEGGTSPYSFAINTEQFSSGSNFGNLQAGNYTVKIKDASGCTFEKQVYVTEKNCITKKSLSFTPEYGEILNIPVSFQEVGTLSVYNRAGILIFRVKTGQSDSIEWNGLDLTGSPAPAGLYVYIIEYSKGQKENGQITVIR